MSALDLERSEALYREMLAAKDEAQRRERNAFQQKWGRFYRCRTCMQRVGVTDYRSVPSTSRHAENAAVAVDVCSCTAAPNLARIVYGVTAIELFESHYRLHQYEPPPEAL